MQEMEMLIFGILNIDPEELSTIALPEQLFALAQSNTTPKSIEAVSTVVFILVLDQIRNVHQSYFILEGMIFFTAVPVPIT